MSEMNLVVVGAGGRMGMTLIKSIVNYSGVKLVGAIEQSNYKNIGKDAGTVAAIGEIGVPFSDQPHEFFAKCDGIIDFTTPSATSKHVELTAQARIVHVIGTTGLSAEDEKKIATASRHARIVKSGNMSLGVNLLANLVKQAARALDEEFDIEILEMHHRHKVDAPSGTALLLGEAAAKGRNINLSDRSVLTREGNTGERPTGDIGFATMRGGSVVGSHNVVFAGLGEKLELSHMAENREVFARGAIKAAIWAFDKKPGLYSMVDVLGLTES